MSCRRALASILLMFSVVSVGGPPLAAQAPTNAGTSLLVPVTGVADVGGMFTGAFIIQRFAQQANGVVAVGAVTGALIANGTIRNLVMQVSMPLDTTASRAALNTDAALAQASCEVLHLELGSASVNVLGSAIALNPVAFDIASTLPSNGAPPSTNPAAPPTATSPQPGTVPPSSQSVTVTPSPSANATQPTTGTPSTVAVAPPSSKTAPSAQTPLGSLLCSAGGLRDVGNAAQLVQQLNGIVAALATMQGF